jgi:hypothetical protein
MDVQPQSENDELINKVRSSRNQFEQEFSTLVSEIAELRTMRTSNIQQLESLTHHMSERRTTLASMEQRVSSMEQTVSSVASLSRSLQSDVEKVAPFVFAALSRRTHRKSGWKAKVKTMDIPVLELRRYYSPREVAAIIGVSYDTAIRRMLEMPGVMDFGTKETRFKRPKRKLRISGRDLMDYIRKHRLDESN